MKDDKQKIFRVMFVCTGNTCRSPMAEGILRQMAENDGLEFMDVTSAGMSTYDGYPATSFAVRVAHNAGIDISSIHSTQLVRELMSEADLILAMAKNHYDQMLSLYPEYSHKVFMLKVFPEHGANPDLGVADPIGLDLDFYEKTFGEIKAELERIWPHIKNMYYNKIQG
jgi:protein-tyrosine-phosphatase